MTHIDWLTIVGHRPVEPADYTVHSAYLTAAQWLSERSEHFIESFGYPMDWQIVRPRAPYAFARRSDDNTRTLYVHPLASHFTFEVSGAHCAKIADRMPLILRDYAEHFSRLDIAVDMETTVTPLQFDQKCNPARVNTRSRFTSSTGETVYIGSRSSDRFCRVYRYNPDHPRSHLLRAEFQLRAGFAKAAAQSVADGVALGGLAADLGRHFGFEHPCWVPSADPVPLVVQSHAQSGRTVHWLTNTVAPLLRRMQREGRLDVQMWLDEYVMRE